MKQIEIDGGVMKVLDLKGIELQQGSPEYWAFRAGKVGASDMADITAKLRNGAPGASRTTLMGNKIVERLTGRPTDSFTSAAMQWGKDNEAAARAAYQFDRMTKVDQVGFVLHPKMSMAGASPDGVIGPGLVEIKCPDSIRHCEALLGAPIPTRYELQMQWQMACTGAPWCDYVSFDPRLPERMQLHVQRCRRDPSVIGTLEHEVFNFLTEVEARVLELRKRYPEAT